MTRSSLVIKSFGLGLLLVGSVACGDKPPAKEPEAPAPTVVDAGEPAPTSAVETPAAPVASATAEATPAPAPTALALPAASAKLKFKTTKDFDVELKSDGTVNSGGKAAAKIAGNELQDSTGKTQLKVDSDGTITTADGGAYAKFDGDTLATNTGAKWMIGDDGAFQSAPEKGAPKSVGKTTDVGAAKRSALLAAAFVTWGTKAPQPAAAKTAAATDKAATDKKAGEKTAATDKTATAATDKTATEKKAADKAAAPKK